MKKERFAFSFIAVLAVSIVQTLFCAKAALADTQWVANGNIQYSQANAASGIFTLQQIPGQAKVTGTLTNSATDVGPGRYFWGVGMDDAKSRVATGEVEFGWIRGNTFELQVRLGSAGFFKGGHFMYQGTILENGLVSGEVYDIGNNKVKVKFNTTTPLTKVEVAPPAPPPTPAATPVPPAQKPIKATGKARNSSSPPPAGIQPGPNPAPWCNFRGHWETSMNDGSTKYMMDLEQAGNYVNGTFLKVETTDKPSYGKITGTIDADGKLAAHWMQRGPDACMGTSGFQMIRGGDSNWFQGDYNVTLPKKIRGLWSGKKLSETPNINLEIIEDYKTSTSGRSPAAGNVYAPSWTTPPTPQVFPPLQQPAGGGIGIISAMQLYQSYVMVQAQLKAANRNFGGHWTLNTSNGNAFDLNLTQNNTSVTGTYQPKNGKIDGTIDADGRLTYTWKDDSSAGGAGIFVIYDGSLLKGSYSLNQNANDVAGTWSGKRL
jgi:hypothetical protein